MSIAVAQARPDRLLRGALLGNALFSSICGLAMIVASGPIAAFIDLGPASILPGIGIGLLLFAADLVHQATRRELSAARAWITVLGDFGWIVGTAVLLVGFPSVLGFMGKLVAVDVALVVGAFMVAQWFGLRRLAAS